MPIKRKNQEFATKLENSRIELELSHSAFSMYLGTGYESLKRWITGKTMPRDYKIVDIGLKLDWPDEVIIGYLKNLPETGILRDLIIRILFLEMRQKLLIDYLKVSKTTYENWRDRNEIVPYDSAKKMVYLMNLSDNELINELKGSNKDVRGELDSQLIKKIEAKYGQLSEAPDDDPNLIKLRKSLRV